ncbi:2617_t:CDS:1 [Ambispora gerdemannii]|uniref:2617_t:CDS:1 n=1 Tax=Ambispora gerdemannii TaxID=144530 RepID=A0A9N9BLS5_9GLOM|nr:2617_t:CDS:1 [Ambispora gerdemannii]
MSDKSVNTAALLSKLIAFVPSTQKFPQIVSTCQEIDTSISEVTEEAKSTCEFYQNVISLPPTSIDKKSNLNNIFSNNTEVKDTWHCDSCTLDIPSQSFEQHLHSTAHLISHAPDDSVPVDPLVLNDTNIGFRILRGQGWTYEKGLGISEQGRRQPITPKIKNDRLGIGLNSNSLKKQRYFKQEKRSKKILLSAKEAARQYEKEKKERINLLAYMNR